MINGPNASRSDDLTIRPDASGSARSGLLAGVIDDLPDGSGMRSTQSVNDASSDLERPDLVRVFTDLLTRHPDALVAAVSDDAIDELDLARFQRQCAVALVECFDVGGW